MKFKAKWVVVLASIIVLAGALYFYYGFLYKDARNVGSEKAEYNVSSSQLVADYTHDAEDANSRYLNNAIEVTGTVTEVADSVVTLDSIIFCGLNHPVKKDILNKLITIKGRCIGYDELFDEVKLDECIIKEQQ